MNIQETIQSYEEFEIELADLAKIVDLHRAIDEEAAMCDVLDDDEEY